MPNIMRRDILIRRWNKKRDSDLVRSKRKNGTGTFERYITAQCVEGGHA